MNAIRVHHFGGVDALIYEDIPQPSPGEGEELLRLRAAGVGPWNAWVWCDEISYGRSARTR